MIRAELNGDTINVYRLSESGEAIENEYYSIEESIERFGSAVYEILKDNTDYILTMYDERNNIYY